MSNIKLSFDYGLSHRLLGALEKAGLSKKLAEKVVDESSQDMAKAMVAALFGGAIPRDRFRPLRSFKVVAPSGIEKPSFVGNWFKNDSDKVGLHSSIFYDDDYAEKFPIAEIRPGVAMECVVYEVVNMVATPEDCYSFLQKEKALLLGVQGILMAWTQGRRYLPKGVCVSFDMNLNPKPSYSMMVPCLNNINILFDLVWGGFESSDYGVSLGLEEGKYLLCFRPIG